MKCAICGSEIKEGLLGKIIGTYVKKGGKMYAICNKCQRIGDKEIKERIINA